MGRTSKPVERRPGGVQLKDRIKHELPGMDPDPSSDEVMTLEVRRRIPALPRPVIEFLANFVIHNA